MKKNLTELVFIISSDRAVRFENDAQGVAVNYHVVSETVSRMREAPCCASIGAEWKEQIEVDGMPQELRDETLKRLPEDIREGYELLCFMIAKMI